MCSPQVVCRATVVDEGLNALYQVYEQGDRLKEGIVTAIFGDDSATAALDIQWVSVAFLGVGALVVGDVALRVIENLLTMRREGQQVDDSGLDSMGDLPGSLEQSVDPKRGAFLPLCAVSQTDHERGSDVKRGLMRSACMQQGNWNRYWRGNWSVRTGGARAYCSWWERMHCSGVQILHLSGRQSCPCSHKLLNLFFFARRPRL